VLSVTSVAKKLFKKPNKKLDKRVDNFPFFGNNSLFYPKGGKST